MTYKVRTGTYPICEDCGAIVADTDTHDHFHGALANQATAIAVLMTSHVGQNMHNRWDVSERFHKRRPDANSAGWSSSAFTEVVTNLDNERSE